MNKEYLRKLSKFIPIIGLILFVYIIIDIGVEEIATTFIMIPISFFLIALVLTIPRVLLYAYKWQYISEKQKMDFDLLYMTKIFLIGVFYGNVTPGGIGWHIRLFYIRKKIDAPLGKCIANSFLDLYSGFVVGLFLSLIGSIVLIEHIPGLFPIILVFFVFYLSAFAVMIKHTHGQKIFRFLIRPLIPRKYKESLGQSFESLYEDIPRLRDMAVPFFLEGVIWFIAGTQTYIIAQAFDIDIPFITFILIAIISVIATGILPISVGGLGVREGTFVYLLYEFGGVEPRIAVVVSLGGYLVKMVIPAIVGMILSFKDKQEII
jgi:uncharacterized protein (TIRG00374 family)